MPLCETILVPTDFSPHADRALEFAVELAKSQGAALHLAHVLDVLPYTTLPGGVPLYDPSMVARAREELVKSLTIAKERLSKAGVTRVETTLIEGQPQREIVYLAEQIPAQLIVMGTHGRSGLAHAFLGSVAERVVRKAPCPVITVPLKDQRKQP